mgnify:FL=1
MKLLDILLENTLEYKVEFVTIKDKDVSQGSASYKDLADAKKFFDSLTNDPEVYRAELKKVMGADSSRNMAGASFIGGTESIERYVHPATKGVSQGGKRSDELTPAELDMRIFGNSRLGTTAEKGFTSKDGTYKYLEEADLTKGETRKLKKMSRDLKKSSKGHASQAKYIDKLVKEDTSLEEIALSALKRRIKDAEEILDSGMADGVPLDNETEMLVQQELAKLKKQAAVEFMRTKQ